MKLGASLQLASFAIAFAACGGMVSKDGRNDGGDATPSHVYQVSAGQYETCAISSCGALWCWGAVNSVQAACDPKDCAFVPAVMRGFEKEVAQVRVGFYTGCATMNDGSGWCWGNTQIALGGARGVAAQVTGIDEPLLEVAPGAGVTCMLTRNGAVWCAGSGEQGQLGDGKRQTSPSPVRVAGLDVQVVAIAVGTVDACAVLADGTLSCWGANTNGELGAPHVPHDKATPVAGLPAPVASVSISNVHTCALLRDSSLWCWGSNLFGQLGDGTNNDASAPEKIADEVTQVAAAVDFTCALKHDGTVWCWGANTYGQLGDGTTMARNTPAQVVALDAPMLDVTARGTDACARTATGTVYCWGANVCGELGIGSNQPEVSRPSRVPGSFCL